MIVTTLAVVAGGPDWLEIAILVVNVVVGLVIFSFRATLRNAVLELELRLREKFVTKEDLNEVKAQVKLADRMDAGFADVKSILDPRATGARRL